jgi:ribosome recycling factor
MFDTKEYSKRFEGALEHLGEELKKIRTGRAHPDMLAGIMVMAYGQNTPLNQVATIAAPEPNQIVVTPFDPANLQDIVLAIRNESVLGFNPSDDGRNVRVPVPALTEEKRREIVKGLSEKGEQARVQLRQIREEARKAAKTVKETGAFGDDELKRVEKGIDDEIAKFNAQIDEVLQSKETEIMTI